ncbi:UDP-N-acetylmuramate dehydrogenase [Lapillicoccus jejuensis]|uniref:UDP-N-acetylenolpyruvoylglucosamine reductase n=1 Tax=Lapillicoccus jejuensis TaxID=402171 RepID=A0A542DWS6_9MICO|nr:UDP-N-acetylmuramate dehydrogenase [Lapillicoccus jejuensis]TQJ07526.1 UDP-N-acetylmuramate dehydrogenase [Lapillicoccus jejuensis]
MREEHDAPLAGLTTMRVGGPAARLVTATTTDELVDAVREVDDADEPLLVVGGGSNLVLPDAGFPGTVVHVATSGVAVESDDSCGGANVRVAAGEPWDDLVARAVAEGWAGIEALSGIPGSTGATPVQNVGAYGQEVATTVAQVRVWDRREQRVQTFFGPTCGFSYRDSRFKSGDGAGGRYVVLDVLFQLRIADLGEPVRYADLARQLDVAEGARAPLGDVREAVLAQRRKRGMVLDDADPDTWSCGSFFTNPVLGARAWAALLERVHERLGADVDPPSWAEPGERTKTSAAWLIERAGFGKGHGLPGPASLSTKHTLAVTNRGGATAADVVALAREVRDGVRDTFGVTLVNEPVLVGTTL